MTRVVLHIGAPKTGTSFIQSVLSNNRDLLQSRGVLWPGSAWGDQVRAVEDLRDAAAGKLASAVRWDEMVDQIDGHSSDVAIISMEWLCLGDRRMAAKAVESFRGHEVHVVLSLRDLARAIPAQWQESTQNGFAWTYQQFLTGLTSTKPHKTRPGSHFWTNQDWARMADVWSPLVPPGHFWVVTVPPAGAPTDLLWTRFCAAAGIDPADYSLAGWPNESLGAASAELMRRLQAARRDDGPNLRHRAKLKHRLAKQTLAEHRKAEPSLVLPPEMFDWTVSRTADLVSALRRVRPRIVGDLGELAPLPPRVGPGVVSDPTQIGDDALLEAAIFGLLGLTRPKA